MLCSTSSEYCTVWIAGRQHWSACWMSRQNASDNAGESSLHSFVFVALFILFCVLLSSSRQIKTVLLMTGCIMLGWCVVLYRHLSICGYCVLCLSVQGIMSFVGSHLDVVPANPETWDRNPFKLVREGDRLYGRGTTDCLGHVALITQLFIQLAEKKVQLNTNLVAIFIAWCVVMTFFFCCRCATFLASSV